jgi:hypothetical protein
MNDIQSVQTLIDHIESNLAEDSIVLSIRNLSILTTSTFSFEA